MTTKAPKSHHRQKRAVIFARVSSRQQDDGHSLDLQVERCRNYAAQSGLAVAKEFRITETGLNPAKRRDFQKVVAYFAKQADQPERQRATDLIVLFQNRLARNNIDILTLLNLGVTIHIAGEGRILSPDGTPEDELMMEVKASIDKYDSKQKGRATRQSMIRAAEAGYWPGALPLGYRNYGRGKKRTIETTPEAEVVRYLFERYATANVTFSQLAREANALGAKVSAHRQIDYKRIGAVLRNPFYKGEFTWGGVYCQRAAHPVIVDPDLWDSVQAKLNGNRKALPRQRRLSFTYQGLMTCACGRAIVGEEKIKPSGRRYVYYRCAANRCPHKKYHSEAAVNAVYANELERMYVGPDLIDFAVGAVQRVSGNDDRLRATQERLLRGQIEKLRKRRADLYRDRQDGIIDLYEYRRFKDEFESELAEKESALKAMQDAAPPILDRARIDYLLQNRVRLFETMPPERKREVVEAVFEGVRVEGGKIGADVLAMLRAV